jgi:adenylate kinase
VRLVLLGPPGAGKGTQAQRLEARSGAKWISTGDILRSHVQNGTELGRKARAYLDAGELVPDDVVIGMVLDAIRDAPEGFILDGFPRTVAQAQGLEEELHRAMQPLSAALAFVVDDEVVVKRLAGRRTCDGCGRIANVAFDPPRVADTCNSCGGRLVQRTDDDEATVRRRLEVYHQNTAPLLTFYRQRGLLREVDADGHEDEVTRRTEAALADLV